MTEATMELIREDKYLYLVVDGERVAGATARGNGALPSRGGILNIENNG
jgi:hypothetical protein